MARIVRGFAVASFVGLLGAARPVPAAPPQAASLGAGTAAADTARARHLLSRATYGVREADLGRLLEIGATAWLDEQLHPAAIEDDGLEARLARFPAASMPQDALYRAYPPPQLLRRSATDDDAEEIEREMRERGLMPPGRILFDLVGAKLQRAVYSERQLEAVMTDFWFNHFNVFFAKGADRWLVGEYEREAIRPHVFGRFEDMLVATARHPAMLFYLDNWQNVARVEVRAERPEGRRLRGLSPQARRRALERRGVDEAGIERIETALARDARRGINENYARELLELHTLGVDGGYDQADVTELARVFTGWTLVPDGAGARPGGRGLQGRPLAYAYRPELHDPGDKRLLGERVEGRTGLAGEEEGLAVLRGLARHPSTARHLATKLARAFAADDPPPALLAELERVYLETDGDLRALTRALFVSDAFQDPALHEAKLKSPFELVASAFRVTGAEVALSRPLIETLQEMGELPYMSSEPTGYPDATEEWASPGSLIQRVNFGLALAAGQLRGARIGALPARLEDGRSVVAVVLPGARAEALAELIDDEIGPEPDLADRRRALGLALGSPEFQRR